MNPILSRVARGLRGAFLSLPVIITTSLAQNDSTALFHQRIAEGIGLREHISADIRKDLESVMAADESGMPEEVKRAFVDHNVGAITTEGIVRTILAPVLDKYFTAEEQEIFAEFAETSYGPAVIHANLADPMIDMATIAEGGDRSEEESRDIFRVYFVYARAQLKSSGVLMSDVLTAYAAYAQELADQALATFPETLKKE